MGRASGMDSGTGWAWSLLPVGLAMAMVSLHCGGEPTCDSVCDNFLQLCGAEATDEAARNACVEECSQRVQDVPSSCGAERDAVLTCLEDADSVDCADPQNSAACSTQVDDLNACAYGGDDTSGSSTEGAGEGSSGTAAGGACEQDDDCGVGVCNGALEVCAAPGGPGDPCYRDSECESDTCLGPSDSCGEPGPNGAPCYRDSECISDTCLGPSDTCGEPGGTGAPCYRDSECISDTCIGPFDACGVPQPEGSACYRDSECASDACVDDVCL